MKYLRAILLFIAGFLTTEGNAQSKAEDAPSENSFMVKIDSVEIDIYQNYESDMPPIGLNNLYEPTLFILNEKELKISKYSELETEGEKIESITVIQDPAEINEMGYSGFNSVVKVITEKEE